MLEEKKENQKPPIIKLTFKHTTIYFDIIFPLWNNEKCMYDLSIRKIRNYSFSFIIST